MEKLLNKKLKNGTVIEIKKGFCLRLNPKSGNRVPCDGDKRLPVGMYSHFFLEDKHYVMRVKKKDYDALVIYSAK